MSNYLYGTIGKLNEKIVRVYAAQLISVLDYLQTQRIMHRDLKPHNILLDENFNLKVIDFGDAKNLGEEDDEESNSPTKTPDTEVDAEIELDPTGNDQRKGTFVGTINYLAPEMIQNNVASMSTDIWSLGCIIYKMLTGAVPFTGTNSYKVFQKILAKDIDYPEYISIEAVALIDALIMVEQKDRLGSPGSRNDMKNLKRHPFFAEIDFDNLE